MAEYKSATSARGTHSQVASGTTSVTILAANSKRKGATIFNTDANALNLRLDGGTATTASAHVRIGQNTYYEIPFGYTGLITGIWEGDGSGAANVCEFI